MCHMSGVMCCLTSFTCHLSLMPTATATNPPTANSPIIHSRLVCNEEKKQKKFKTQKNLQNGNNWKMSRGKPKLAGKRGFRNCTNGRLTDIAT